MGSLNYIKLTLHPDLPKSILVFLNEAGCEAITEKQTPEAFANFQMFMIHITLLSDTDHSIRRIQLLHWGVRFMILKIVLALVVLMLLIVLWVLFTPVLLYADTDEGCYEIRQRGVFQASAHYTGGLQWQWKILGIPVRVASREPERIARPRPVRKPVSKPAEAWVAFVRRVFRSVTLTRFQLDIDTGDVVLNAHLIPLFCVVQRRHFRITTNFTGRTYAHVELKAHPHKLLWAFFKFLTTHK
jgi:hypothetical protein